MVYILHCADNTLYTWITTDIERRIDEHNHSPLWAKYTKTRRPVTLAWSQEVENRSQASKLELTIKKMKKEKKVEMIEKVDQNS